MAVGLERSGAAGHHVTVEVDGVDRVGDGDAHVFGEEFLDVRDVALGAVTHEDVVRVHFDAAGGIFTADDGFAQKVVALFRAVPAEARRVGEFVRRPVHCLNHRRCERSRHVADAEADDVCVFVGALIFLNLFCDGREKVAAGQAIVKAVDVRVVHY